MRKLCFLIVFTTLLTKSLEAQVTIIVDQIPDNTPGDVNIHIAGNFNGWDPGNASHILEKQDDGTYQIELPEGSGTLEYKFTRGDWSSVEGDANGNEIANRTYTWGSATSITDQIQTWKDLEGTDVNLNTAAENVEILFDDFLIPQLNRQRRIWLYLPPNYNETTLSYPVFYMHDGQNVFNQGTSFSGEWKVDEALNKIFENGGTPCIVVAIDNGQNYRTEEYTPWRNENYGGGRGDDYVRFIIETLKPYIDENYRTKPEREFTGIAGSSLGGLISHYAGIKYPETFGMIGAFSPAFWINPEIQPLTESYDNPYETKFLFLVSQNEGTQYVNTMNQVIDLLKGTGVPETSIRTLIHEDGAHSEWYWAREFPDAYRWLVGDLVLSTNKSLGLGEEVKFYPNPAKDRIKIELNITMDRDPRISIFDTSGKLIFKKPINQRKAQEIDMDIKNISKGYYILNYADSTQSISQPLMIID